MIGRIEETSASFEARYAPRSYPTPISRPRQAANVSQAASAKEVNSLKLSRGSVHKDNDPRRSPDRGRGALDVALTGLIAERLATEPTRACVKSRHLRISSRPIHVPSAQNPEKTSIMLTNEISITIAAPTLATVLRSRVP
jgi:hypothetical protein